MPLDKVGENIRLRENERPYLPLNLPATLREYVPTYRPPPCLEHVLSENESVRKRRRSCEILLAASDTVARNGITGKETSTARGPSSPLL